MAPSPSPCICCSTTPTPPTETEQYNDAITDPPLVINTSDFNIHTKEVIILGLIFLLLIYSVITFLNRWSKNYRDINQAPYYNEKLEDQFSGVFPPLSWEEEDDLSVSDSRMSRVVRAKSVMERKRSERSCSYEYRPPSRMSRPRKSLSASNIFTKSRAPKLFQLRRPPYSDPKNPHNFSTDEDFSSKNCSFECHRLTPRISIDEMDSESSQPSIHRPYLRYQTRSQVVPMASLESDTSKQISQDIFSQNSRSNLQICQNREDGGSFSFSDLDPVREDLELTEESELKENTAPPV